MGRSSSLHARWPLLILLGVGLLFLLGGAAWMWKTWSFTGRAWSARGTIERLELRLDTTSRESDESPTYAPVFSYRDTEGRVHVVTSAVSHSTSPYEPGQQVPVLYDPDNPESARIDSAVQLWFLPIVFGLLGSALLGMGWIGWQKLVATQR